MNRGDCKHPSAFCTMTFRTPRRDVEEVVWNSRDMAVPATIMHGRIELAHADPHRDEFKPFHVPRVGTRIFIDPVLDKAEAAAEAAYAENCHTEGFAEKYGATPRDAIATLITENLARFAETMKPTPVLVTVTPEMAAKIQTRLEKRGIR